jgi:hypothetical protein
MEQPTTIRPVCVSDLDGVFEVLRQVADRIPLNLSTPAHVEAILQQIKTSYFGGLSLVATDAEGKVIGFQLAREIRWFEELQISLAYAGVSASSEDGGIFRRLIEAMKSQILPLVAEVRAGNKSDMGARLMRYGFQCTGANEFQWRPGSR